MDFQENNSGEIPEKIGKYEVREIMGRGGMGVVYRGYDRSADREVAIKTLMVDDPGLLERFHKEGRNTAKLNHPNIVTVFEVGVDNGTPFIAMECVAGQPLDKILKSEPQLPLPDGLEVLAQVCDALGYAHRNSMVHRDVKPANIFVQPDGSAKLLDFGIAREERVEQDIRLTRTGHLIGTVQYMAPERLRDQNVDGRSDIFAMGVVLFQMVTGQMPFTGAETVIMQKILGEPHPSLHSINPNLPPMLESVVDRALAKSLDERYPTAEEMAADLRVAITDLHEEQIKELLPEAQRLFDQQELMRSRTVLHQILKLDGKHSEARTMLNKIQQQMTQKQREEKVQVLRQQAEDAMSSNRYDQMLNMLEGSTELVEASPELVKLREKAAKEKDKQDKLNDLLKQVDNARRKGDYTAALAAVTKAIKLDKTNTKLTALNTTLEQEAEQAKRQAQAKTLLESVRSELNGRRFSEALVLLKQVEEVDPTNPEIPLLVGDANSGLEQVKRREVIAKLEAEVDQANTTAEIKKCAEDVKEAMAAMPAESLLYRLNAQVERKVKDQENRVLADETIAQCRTLRPTEALELVRKVRRQLPTEEKLISLEGMLAERCRQQSVDEKRGDYLAQAQEAIKKQQFSEAVRALELCEAEGIATGEILSLLEFARNEEAEHRKQEQFRKNLTQAQGLIGNFAYEDAIEFLENAIRQNDDTTLHLLLEQATNGRDALRQQIDTILNSVRGLVQNGKHSEAIQILSSQQQGVLRSSRVQATLVALTEERQQALYRMVGRSYGSLNSDPRVGEMTARRATSAAPKANFFPAVTESFRARGQVFADHAVSEASRKMRNLPKGGTRDAIVQILQDSAAASQYASPEMQTEWKRMEEKLTKTGRR